MRKLLEFIISRLNTSTIIAIILLCMLIFAYQEIIILTRWFISDQMKVLLSDKTICVAIGGAIVTLLNKSDNNDGK
jgi:hypothetical protein